METTLLKIQLMLMSNGRIQQRPRGKESRQLNFKWQQTHKLCRSISRSKECEFKAPRKRALNGSIK